MPQGQVLEFSGITKRFGAVTAVSGFSARVEPGRVTGFLGPNGAGKTTTLRILLGLVRPGDGSATIGGLPYSALKQPLQTVGAVLEASSFHPGRSAANHLKVYAQAAGIPVTRVEETLGLVGLADVGGRKVGGFSLGMRQRLGLAYALLGDPAVLVLDEPANGLDPEGIKWMRGFLRQLAREGRTVFVSSHLLAEVQQTVDSVLIISQGRLVFQGSLEDLADPSEFATVVDSPDRAALSAALKAADVPFELLRSGITVRGLDPVAVGGIAASAGVALSSLQRRGPALEEVFLDLVSGVRVHPTAGVSAAAGGAAGAMVAGDADGEPSADAAPAESAAEDAAVADADAAAATETAAVAAELDAQSGSAPAAAVATGAAAGAVAWAASGSDDETDAEPPVDPSPSPTYAVASTGVIDIIAFAGDPATDAYQDGLPLDEDPDVEALGAIDEELSDALPPLDAVGVDEPVSADRPWERYVKTDADVEADAFFASFTAADAAAAAAADSADVSDQADAAVEAEPTEPIYSGDQTADDLGAQAEPEYEPEPAQASEQDAAPEGEPDAEANVPPDAEANVPPVETESGGESGPEPEPEPDTAPDPATGSDQPAESPETAAAASDAPADGGHAEPDADTSELGTLADLSPDWVEDDVHARADDEGGEQR